MNTVPKQSWLWVSIPLSSACHWQNRMIFCLSFHTSLHLTYLLYIYTSQLWVCFLGFYFLPSSSSKSNLHWSHTDLGYNHPFALFTSSKSLTRGFKLNQCGFFFFFLFFNEATSAAGPQCILSRAILWFNTGAEGEDRGEDRKKETLSARERQEKAERTLCSTLLPSNTCSLSVPILSVDASSSLWIGFFQAWHEAPARAGFRNRWKLD